jgi:hypothetical protein
MKLTFRSVFFLMLMAFTLGAGAAEVYGRAVGCSFCGHSTAYPYHYPNCRYYGLGLKKSGTGTGSTAIDPQIQMMQTLTPLLQNMIQDMFKTDPVEEAQRRQAIFEAAERARQEEERRRAEEERERQEMFERLSSQLKLSGLGGLAPKGFDGNGRGLNLKGISQMELLELKLGDEIPINDGNDLKPQGTSFFGLGGAGDSQLPPEPSNDPMVVDLRNCRRAAFLVEAAEKASPEDAERLIDEAVLGAQGDTGFVADPPAGTVPVVSEAGLIAFQKANIAYAKAHDFRLRQTEVFNQAQLRRELVAKAIQIKQAELEKDLAQKLDKVSLEEKHRLMAEIFAAAKAEYETWIKAKAEMDIVRSREAFERVTLLDSVRITPVPSPRIPAEVIRQEREVLEPSFMERKQHEALKVLSNVFSEDFDTFINEHYLDSPDPIAEDRVNRLVKHIQNLSPYPDDFIEVKIIGQPRDPSTEEGFEKGAWTAGNTIYIGSGYLNRVQPPSDDELLFTIGHEMAHIQRDHYVLAYGAVKYEEGRDWVQALLGTEESKWRPDIKDVVRKVRLHDLNYAQELEADRLGTALCLAAGAKVEGLRDFFGRSKSYSSRTRLQELTSSHPPANQRFYALKQIYGDVLGDPWK